MRTARPFDTKLLDREAMSRALHRQLTGLGGVLLMALSAVAVTALVTWSVNDPSFNHATDAAPVNFLGYGGAVFSDLMMQLIGLASVVFLAPVALWGWYLAARGEIDHEGLRLAGWLAAILGG
ncbi:MAG: DNA translocase FtsK 4TM domain-containing protein, partial [Hyphomicrobiaceae bacterium]|nr:DNA translocase FtsK 4TM domain-containing protein [Hyphomicrobiaceae bacterium]